MNSGWLAGLLAGAVVFLIVALVAWRGAGAGRRMGQALPTRWELRPRLYFNAAERRLYGWIKGAFPAHIILVKAPLTRYTMPTDRERAGYWYELIGPLYTTFALCEMGGRVIAAIDVVDRERGSISRRAQFIKRGVLRTCGIRYVTLEIGTLPSLAHLRELVLGEAGAQVAQSPSVDTGMAQARETLERKVRDRRADRERAFADSRHDGADSHLDSLPSSTPPTDADSGPTSRTGAASSFGDSRQPTETTWTWPAPLDDAATTTTDGLSDAPPTRPPPSDPRPAIQALRDRHVSHRALRLDSGAGVLDQIAARHPTTPVVSAPAPAPEDAPRVRPSAPTPSTTGHIDLEL